MNSCGGISLRILGFGPHTSHDLQSCRCLQKKIVIKYESNNDDSDEDVGYYVKLDLKSVPMMIYITHSAFL